MTTIIPRNDNVLVRPDDAEKMRGTLHLPASAIHHKTRGSVVAVGPGVKMTDGTWMPLDLEIDARVEFNRNAHLAVIDFDGIDHFMFHESAILAVVGDEPQPEISMPASLVIDEDVLNLNDPEASSASGALINAAAATLPETPRARIVLS